MNRNTVLTLLAVLVAAAIVIFAVYYFFLASGCSDCPKLEYYHADTCPFCKEMNPVMNKIKDKYKRQVNFVYVNVSRPSGKEKGREAGVLGTPTFLFYDRDDELAYRLQGIQPRELIEKQLDNLINK